MMKKNYILLFFLIAQLAVQAQTIRRVSTDGLSTNNGSSWSATMDLQSAISASAKGDQVWVKEGTYTPTTRFYPTGQTDDIYKTFILGAGVKIYGGFSGNEATLAGRTILNPTKLSGYHASSNKYSLHVLMAGHNYQSENDIMLLDNVHITNGRTTTSNISTHAAQGAAIYFTLTPSIELNNIEIYDCQVQLGAIYLPDGAKLKIKNSSFYNNTSNGSANSNKGTCIHALDNTTVDIENSTFRDNKKNNTASAQAGAIHIVGSNTKSSTLNIKNSTFSNNESNTSGGALRIENLVYVTINNSIFKSNKVWPTVTNTYNFEDANTSNRVIHSGGGAIVFTCNNDASTVNGWIKIINSRFENNASTARGGAIIITSPNNTESYIKNSYFSNNTADISGAALDYRQSNKTYGSATLGEHNQSFIINNNIFNNNSVKYYGGAISVTASCPIVLANNTFYRNAITENTIASVTNPTREIGGGAAIHFASAGATRGDLLRAIVNNIFAENTASTGSNYTNIVPGTTTSTENYTRNSIFVDGNGFTTDTDASVITQGFTSADIFKSTNPYSSHFLRLLPNNTIGNNTNPAINSGLNPITIFKRTISATQTATLTYTTDSLDLANNSRVLANIIDMGAYEAHALDPETLPVEFVSLTIQKVKSGAQLTWKVAFETNNEKFVIERSIDGIKFETIGNRNSLGNTSNAASYSFIDSKPENGTSYYRLSQVDLDGTPSILAVKPFNLSLNASEVLIYPVPTKDILTIKVLEPQGEYISIDLFSITGRKVLSQSFNKQAATQGAQLNLKNLIKGVYVVVINNGNTIEKRAISVAK